MTIWAERFKHHPLWPEVERARAIVNQLDIDVNDRAQQDALAYAGAVLELMERRRADSDPLEVTPSMLNETNTQAQQWSAALDNVLDVSWVMTDAVGPTDNVLTSLAAWPPMKIARYLSGIQASVDSFAAKVEEALVRVSKASTSVDDELAKLTKDQTTLRTNIDTEKQRIAEAVATFTTESAAEVTTLIDEQEERIAGQIGEWKATDTGYRADAKQLIEQLKKHEESAKKTVHATVAWTVATDYGKYARNKSIAAWLCDLAAAIVGAAGVGAILWHLFTMDSTADTNIGLSLTRLAASLGALGVAALIGKRGAQHHEEARAAKRTDLALRKVGPFIVDLAEDEQKVIIQEFTDRVFIRGDLDSVDIKGRTPLRETILAMRKEKAAAGSAP